MSKGAVKLVDENGQSIFAFTEGNYFGEIEAISDVIFTIISFNKNFQDKRLSFCQSTEPTILLICERESFLESLKDFPSIETQIKRTVQTRKQKIEAKISLLKKRQETQDQEDQFNNKKLLNSTEHFNKVVVKSFQKEKKKIVLKKSNTSQILPKIDLNSTTFLKKSTLESSIFSPQEPKITRVLNKEKISPVKSFKNALETVNEEKLSATSPGPGKRLFNDKEPTSPGSGTKIKGSKFTLKALSTVLKEEEKELLDDTNNNRNNNYRVYIFIV